MDQEKENIIQPQENNAPESEEKQEDKKEKGQKLSTPMAIVIAGLLIMVGILLTRGGGNMKEKTLSEQVGVSKTSFEKCVSSFNKEDFVAKIQTSVAGALKGEDGFGTPYSIVIGSNGIKSKVNGADSYENVKKVIDEVMAGKVTNTYSGEVPPVDIDTDHIFGDTATAKVVIIEYSDFECPYCAKFHPTLEKIVTESNGQIAWVYRHFPLTQIHQHAMERAIASECVAKIKGNDAFWNYAELLFGLLNPKPAVSEQL